jgi:sulfopyruvate decarboxylase TPP-binding subunit
MNMGVKIAFIEATLPELKGGRMYQSGRGEGTNAPAAISRAFKDMLRKVKGKRISIIKAQITLTTKADNEVQRITDIPEYEQRSPEESGDQL